MRSSGNRKRGVTQIDSALVRDSIIAVALRLSQNIADINEGKAAAVNLLAIEDTLNNLMDVRNFRFLNGDTIQARCRKFISSMKRTRQIETGATVMPDFEESLNLLLQRVESGIIPNKYSKEIKKISEANNVSLTVSGKMVYTRSRSTPDQQNYGQGFGDRSMGQPYSNQYMDNDTVREKNKGRKLTGSNAGAFPDVHKRDSDNQKRSSSADAVIGSAGRNFSSQYSEIKPRPGTSGRSGRGAPNRNNMAPVATPSWVGSSDPPRQTQAYRQYQPRVSSQYGFNDQAARDNLRRGHGTNAYSTQSSGLKGSAGGFRGHYLREHFDRMPPEEQALFVEGDKMARGAASPEIQAERERRRRLVEERQQQESQKERSMASSYSSSSKGGGNRADQLEPARFNLSPIGRHYSSRQRSNNGVVSVLTDNKTLSRSPSATTFADAIPGVVQDSSSASLAAESRRALEHSRSRSSLKPDISDEGFQRKSTPPFGRRSRGQGGQSSNSSQSASSSGPPAYKGQRLGGSQAVAGYTPERGSRERRDPKMLGVVSDYVEAQEPQQRSSGASQSSSSSSSSDKGKAADVNNSDPQSQAKKRANRSVATSNFDKYGRSRDNIDLSLQERYNNLQREYDELGGRYNNLHSRFNTLEADYNILKSSQLEDGTIDLEAARLRAEAQAANYGIETVRLRKERKGLTEDRKELREERKLVIAKEKELEEQLGVIYQAINEASEADKKAIILKFSPQMEDLSTKLQQVHQKREVLQGRVEELDDIIEDMHQQEEDSRNNSSSEVDLAGDNNLSEEDRLARAVAAARSSRGSNVSGNKRKNINQADDNRVAELEAKLSKQDRVIKELQQEVEELEEQDELMTNAAVESGLIAQKANDKVIALEEKLRQKNKAELLPSSSTASLSGVQLFSKQRSK